MKEEEVGIQPQSVGFSGDICDKFAKLLRGLTRHRNSKHSTANNVESDSSRLVFRNLKQRKDYTLFILNIYIEESALKLSVDECYSEKNRKEFSAGKLSGDDARFTYEYVKDMIVIFKGEFYPLFYKAVSKEKVFKNISNRSSGF